LTREANTKEAEIPRCDKVTRSRRRSSFWRSGCCSHTVYVERAVEELRRRSHDITDEHLKHLFPLGWEHIALTGVYRCDPEGASHGQLRPLRS
jgi:hypothetical protein